MKIRFLADADLNRYIVSGVLRQEPEVDFKTAQAAGLDGLPDDQVLSIASSEKRVLVTHDRRTMPSHFANFVAKQECSGIIIVPRKLRLSLIIDDLILIWGASEAEEFTDALRFLPL